MIFPEPPAAGPQLGLKDDTFSGSFFYYGVEDDLLRNIRDYSSRLELNMPTDHVPAFDFYNGSSKPELKEFLEKLRRITAQDLRTTNGKQTRATEELSQHGISQQAESGEISTAAQEAGGDTLPPPATRAEQRTWRRGPPANVDMSTVNDRALREAASFTLHTKVALWDVAHSKDMQSFVEYALTATNIPAETSPGGGGGGNHSEYLQ